MDRVLQLEHALRASDSAPPAIKVNPRARGIEPKTHEPPFCPSRRRPGCHELVEENHHCQLFFKLFLTPARHPKAFYRLRLAQGFVQRLLDRHLNELVMVHFALAPAVTG